MERLLARLERGAHAAFGAVALLAAMALWGAATGVHEDICVIAYDLYVAAGKNTPDAAVEAVTRGIWEGVDKLKPIHTVFAEWTRERAVDPDATIPYHPGAVRFYRERGVWTPAMEQAQQKLLNLAR